MRHRLPARFGSLVGHLRVLDERGMPPVHGANTPPKLPGLYFVGVTIELAGLLREIGLEAPRGGPRRWPSATSSHSTVFAVSAPAADALTY